MLHQLIIFVKILDKNLKIFQNKSVVTLERCPSLAEGARLESVYTGNCIRGSNPLLSVQGFLSGFNCYQSAYYSHFFIFTVSNRCYLFLKFVAFSQRGTLSLYKTNNSRGICARESSLFLHKINKYIQKPLFLRVVFIFYKNFRDRQTST